MTLNKVFSKSHWWWGWQKYGAQGNQIQIQDMHGQIAALAMIERSKGQHARRRLGRLCTPFVWYHAEGSGLVAATAGKLDTQ